MLGLVIGVTHPMIVNMPTVHDSPVEVSKQISWKPSRRIKIFNSYGLKKILSNPNPRQFFEELSYLKMYRKILPQTSSMVLSIPGTRITRNYNISIENLKASLDNLIDFYRLENNIRAWMSEFMNDQTITTPQLCPKTSDPVHLSIQLEKVEFLIALSETQPGHYQIRDVQDYYLVFD
jgi:hypothetical protein